MIKDLDILESAGVTVDEEGLALRIRGAIVPFSAILHIECRFVVENGSTEVSAWREQRAVARIITEDRMHDPLLIEIGVRASASDGAPPEFDLGRVRARVRRVAEAAARVAGVKVVAK